MQIGFNLWLKWNIPTEISSFAVTDIEENCAAAAQHSTAKAVFFSPLASTFSAINRYGWTVVVAGLHITKIITDGLTMLDIQVVKL